MGDNYKLTGIHHVHYYVGNVKQAAFYDQKAWGFTAHAYQGLETGERQHTSIVLKQGKIILVLTAPLNPDGLVNEFLNRHGDAIRDIAFGTDDALAAFASSTAGGAEGVSEPRALALRSEASARTLPARGPAPVAGAGRGRRNDAGG